MAETNQKNEELAKLLTGRTISGTAQSNGETVIRFDDGSKLTVRTPAGSNSNSASTGGTVSGVRFTEDPPTLHLETGSGGSMPVPLGDSAGDIRLENKNGDAEYGN